MNTDFATNPLMNRPYEVPVERVNGGEPVISPSTNWWETGVTFNPAAIYLPPTPENTAVIGSLLPMLSPSDPALAQGVVAVYYRARPEVDPGSVPEKIGPGRYLHIYHTGNYLNETDREYDLDAAIFDFNTLRLPDPRSLVTARLEPLMVPETPAERRSRSQLQVGNVLFACGSYIYEGWLYLVYGGADNYTLTALSALNSSGLQNPFT
jgi:hypothetical protein